jgi:hypothetical protein
VLMDLLAGVELEGILVDVLMSLTMMRIVEPTLTKLWFDIQEDDVNVYTNDSTILCRYRFCIQSFMLAFASMEILLHYKSWLPAG